MALPKRIPTMIKYIRKMKNQKSSVVYANEKGYEMKRALLAIRNRLVLEAVTNALKRAGFFVEKSSSQ